ncbi:hypothetical protein FACS1894102_3750 [Spirochaetia bacterium]|nr:hypothetical protein FACS1894102_3750 [Spirochaetia bacterium]
MRAILYTDTMDPQYASVRVKSPIWVKLSTIIILLLLVALTLDTVVVSFLVGGDVRITAESNNYSLNQQMERAADNALSEINSGVWMLLSVLAASWDKEMQIENFFRLHRNIAALVIPGEMELVNKAFFDHHNIKTDILQSELERLDDSIKAAAYGESLLLNETPYFGQPILAMLFPKQSGTNNAVVVFFSSESLNEAFGGRANQSMLIDYNGNILAHPDIEILQSESDSGLSSIIGENQNHMQVLYTDPTGTQYFTAYQKLNTFKAVVITQIAEKLVYEGVRATVKRNIYLSAIILFASIIFAWFFSRSISGPLHRLARRARQIEMGNYDIGDAVTKSKDEVGFLAERFVAMGRGLQNARTELENINASLEETVKERTSDLQAQTEIAYAASKSKSTFLAQMSHEIRTPMNAIMGMTELMRTDNMDETQQSYFKDIRMMSNALLNIINEILDISKIEAGNLSLVPIHYNLHDLFDNVASISKFAAHGKTLEINFLRDKSVPHIVYGDDIRVRQILTNIINNAIKYTPKGSVDVTLTTGNKAGETSASEYIIAKVKDSGIGIKEENLGKLFGSFQQFDAEKNRGIIGTGLGLAITKQLIDLMQGTITVDSVYGEGSTFTCYIPLVKGNAAFVKNKENNENFVRAKQGVELNILVVDDAPINITVALGFLEKHNIRADSALGGLEAIECINKKNYDLIFSDHFMPDIDGLELTRRIRAQGKTMPIIALSANAVSGMREKFIAAGMNDFITKPIESSAINEALSLWLPKEKIVIGGSTETSSKTAFADEFMHITGLNVDEGLKYSGDNEKVYVQILRQYVESLDERLASIKCDLQNGNWKNYSIAAHAFKGIMATLGHNDLSAAAKELEFAGKAAALGEGEDYDELYEYENKEAAAALCLKKNDALCAGLSKFRDDILKTSFFKNDEKKECVGLDAIREILVRLKDACDEYDGGTAVRIVGELNELSFEDGLAETMAAILKDVNAIEYEGASTQIGNLLSQH